MHYAPLFLFGIFALLCVAGALNLLLQRHPINSALSLVVVMMSLAVIYWTLGAEFLAAAQVIVYSGAIMVLFTFVIMLLNAGEEVRTRGSKAAYLAGIPGVVGVLTHRDFNRGMGEETFAMKGGHMQSSFMPLSSDAVHYAGQIVGLVLADTLEAVPVFLCVFAAIMGSFAAIVGTRKRKGR